MTNPKRHHWWPQLQSKHWRNSDGLIYATRRDGDYFATDPVNIGLEGDLYTRYDLTGAKDLTIERWFSSEIEGPFRETIDFLSELPGLRREQFFPDPEKKTIARSLGFVAEDFRETIELPPKHRLSLTKYLAALVVRNPRYLSKIRAFHSVNSSSLAKGRELPADKIIKTISLDNMLRLFNQYGEVIIKSELMLIRRDCENEFLFSDAGIAPEEPWLSGTIPFDIHAPLTPDLCIEVLPVPPMRSNSAMLATVKNAGVARLNRIVLGEAERFIFSRKIPPVEFIKKYFGKPAPKSIAHRYVNGKLEVIFDPIRDRE